MFKNYKWNFAIFMFHLLFFPTILALYLHILYQCVRVAISYFLVYHMSIYLVYQESYRQLSGNYPKSHCDLLTLSLTVSSTAYLHSWLTSQSPSFPIVFLHSCLLHYLPASPVIYLTPRHAYISLAYLPYYLDGIILLLIASPFIVLLLFPH